MEENQGHYHDPDNCFSDENSKPAAEQDFEEYDLAEAEFERFIKFHNIDVDIDPQDINEQKDFSEIKESLLQALRDNHLIFDQECNAIFTPYKIKSKPLIFTEPCAYHLAAADRAPIDQPLRRAIYTIASITNTKEQFIAKLKGTDFQVCVSIQSLFMNARSSGR